MQYAIVVNLTIMCNVWEDSLPEIEGQIKQIVARIKTEREKARVSKMDLSLMAGLSQNLVNYIESGKRIPNMGTLLKICKALQIEPASLFADTDANRDAARETIISLVKKYV
ncbi:MAG: helix-turn-helix domain-containing protein [Spirochaetaceae bacterium]|jgi:transcriptional regulator with XRE-family HTH domain|nr:helix-turn-helix domain-containing protein [Spirochaetaceae bacterium]